MADVEKQVNDLKVQGNKALEEGNAESAVDFYTQALQLAPKNHILFSNRSAASAKIGNYKEALEDAETTIEINPEWAKGYSRKGTALCYLKRYEEAVFSFEEGLKIDPDNKQIKDGLTEAKSHLTGPGGSSQSFANPFADPNLFAKLEANEKTRQFLQQPDYRFMMEMLQKNPNNMQNLQDPRMITTLGVLMGLDLESMKEPSMSQPTSSSNFQPKTNSSTAKSQNSSTPELTQAQEQKALGNAAYKKREFAAALEHYEKAVELDPTDMSFLTNRAAVYFEQHEYDSCIEECGKAIEVGRDSKATFQLIAKAFTRMANAYDRKKDYNNAVIYYNKSLAEHRDSDIVSKVTALKKRVKEDERLAYINPDLSEEAKNQGNDLFKAGKFPDAIKYYDEAIKRNPTDAKLYSNRAACYTKLLELPLALKDADECIRLDSTFVKGYLRKGNIYTAMKQPHQAALAYQRALEQDSNCQEAQDGYKSAVMAESNDPEAVKQRAMADPEIQQILTDPAMQLILQQMQKDPNAVREHLKNPEVAVKIEKLLECGIIAIR